VLTEAVRRRPYQVILFDEVEKAHSDVFNILLQVLDDGRLTDGQGRTVDFSNTLIVLTSNLGSQYLANVADDQAVESVEPQVMEIVRAHFRPEFLNRLDEVILFHRLGQAHMAPIVDLQVAHVQRLLTDRKVTLDLTDAARAWLGRVGYDPVYGARPLRRAVQKYLQDPLADAILRGEVPDGSTVRVEEATARWRSRRRRNGPLPMRTDRNGGPDPRSDQSASADRVRVMGVGDRIELPQQALRSASPQIRVPRLEDQDRAGVLRAVPGLMLDGVVERPGLALAPRPRLATDPKGAVGRLDQRRWMIVRMLVTPVCAGRMRARAGGPRRTRSACARECR
jgi:hypothetical protein